MECAATFEPAAAAGHPLASAIGAEILDEGGNAVDAGVAMGIALSVLESVQVQFSGVAAIMVRDGTTGRVITIAGLGPWPGATDTTAFRQGSRSYIPQGIRRTVVPAAPDAWITALRLYGTLSFADVAMPAIRLAKEGFPAHKSLSDLSRHYARYLRPYPDNARIWLPDGEPIQIGQHFVQAELASTLQFLADEDRAASARNGREAGLTAARDAFYIGDIGKAIVNHVQAEGGWLSHNDMSAYRSPVEDAIASKFNGHTILSCGPWSQGAVVPMTLKILENLDFSSIEHNSGEYLHAVTEAIKLAYSDREKFLGESLGSNAPIEQLLSAAYAAERLDLIDPDRAWPTMPPPGDIPGHGGVSSIKSSTLTATAINHGPQVDTSICCAVDRDGTVFAATPSDQAFASPAVPGLGIVVSTRGAQSYGLAGHAATALPGKRPRLTAVPTMALTKSGGIIAAGGPGADGQPQALVQVLLNCLVFGMDLNEAIKQPRVRSLSFPASHEPHAYFAGVLEVDKELSSEALQQLANLGHRLSPNEDGDLEQAAVCALLADPIAGATITARDPRF